MSYLKYKGYLGTIEPDLETGELFGKLAFIRDLITYEAWRARMWFPSWI